MVEVVSRQFAVPRAAVRARRELAGLLPDSSNRYVELAVLSLLTLIVLFFGVRPALNASARRRPRRPAPTAVVLGADGKPLLVHGATGATIGVDRAGNPVVVREPIALDDATSPPGRGVAPDQAGSSELVALKNVRGPVQASLLGEVSKAIETNPDDAVRVVRGWLHGRKGEPAP